MTPPPRAPRLDSLTGLRACAALLVFAGHAALTSGTDWALMQTPTAVSFFFVLSGFVLMWVRDDLVSTGRFYRKRFARLFPAYAATWVLGIALSLAIGMHEGVLKAVAGMFLLQSWVPDTDWYWSYNSVAWSLSCEAFFYLTFPWWAPAIGRASSRARFKLGFAAVALLALIAMSGELQAALSTSWAGSERIEWAMRVFPPVRLLEFFLGALLAAEMRNGRRFPVPLYGAVLLAAIAYLALPHVGIRWQWTLLPLLPLIAVVGAAAQSDLDGRHTVFKNPVMLWLGEISYSFYLVHQLVVRAVAERVSDVPVLFAVSLVGSILAAAALHRLVEMPLNRRLRGEQPPSAPKESPTSISPPLNPEPATEAGR